MNTRARAGVLLLTAAAGLSAAWNLARNRDPECRWAACVGRYSDERYEGIDDLILMRPRATAGFVDAGGWEECGCGNGVQAYYLSQYALAPRVIVEDVSLPRVIVDGRPGGPLPPELEDKGVVMRNPGNGALLFRWGVP